jgi:hypothetical protein
MFRVSNFNFMHGEEHTRTACFCLSSEECRVRHSGSVHAFKGYLTKNYFHFFSGSRNCPWVGSQLKFHPPGDPHAVTPSGHDNRGSMANGQEDHQALLVIVECRSQAVDTIRPGLGSWVE